MSEEQEAQQISFPPVMSQQPTIVPQKQYDRWWIEAIQTGTTARNTPEQSSSMMVIFTKGRKVDGVPYGPFDENNQQQIYNDVWEMSNEQVAMPIADVFAFAKQKAEEGDLRPLNMLNEFMTFLVTTGFEMGVIK